MRIVSLIPSATETLYALGLGDAVAGVSHECNYPPDAASKPRLLRAAIDHERLSSAAIDQAVQAAIRARHSLYTVDLDALKAAKPDLIVTQSLCDVCAVTEAGLEEALRQLQPRPEVLALHPHTLEEVFREIRLLGHAVNRSAEAGRLVASLAARIERVEALVAGRAATPTVFCLEWLAPPMACGHWVPEMVAAAGGREVLGRAGAASRYVTVEELAAAAPAVLVLMPCGFSVARTRRELPLLTAQPWWPQLPAVQQGRVFIVDGPAYFNQSGPRLVDGIELLAGLLHPDRCPHLVPADVAAV